jgi:leader peptidase (prepilin peptidase)/N-methyltransferase
MGNGDFKLLAALGAWCGVSAILPIVLLSSLVGAVIGGIGLKLLAKDSDTQIPFGPFLAIAGWIWFLFGPELSAVYWGLVLPPGATAP